MRDADQYPNEQLVHGAKVFRFQCSVCHTTEGVNGLTHLSGSWTTDQKRMNIAKLQRTKPFMPPFAGTADDVEAVVQLIEWINAGRPDKWEDTSDWPYPSTVIGRWLEEAGTSPGFEIAHGEVVDSVEGG
jgi:mono/diheme cytochrome c family protein